MGDTIIRDEQHFNACPLIVNQKNKALYNAVFPSFTIDTYVFLMK